MNLTAEKLQFASIIDAKVKSIGGPGVDDFTIFAEMADYLPAFNRLMDTSKPAAMDELCRRLSFAGHERRVPTRSIAALLHFLPSCRLKLG
jgi:hypothetical protein